MVINQDNMQFGRNDEESAIRAIFQTIQEKIPDLNFILSNSYRELPIISNARLHEIHEQSIGFKVSPLQFAAIQNNCQTTIQAPLLAAGVVGRLVDLDPAGSIVSLERFSYAKARSNRRMTVRVRLSRPMNVHISADGRKLAGLMCDISLGGCRIVSAAGMVLEPAKDLYLHLKLFQDNKILKTAIPFTLLRVECDVAHHRFALLFHHTEATKKFLSSFIFQHQHEIMLELTAIEQPQGALQYGTIPSTVTESVAEEDVEKPGVLIIHKELAKVAALENMLRPAGYNTMRAYSGWSGKSLARYQQPSLILLDLDLPDGEGTVTYRMLQDDHRTADIPVILMSASPENAFHQGAPQTCPPLLITKPVVSEKLLDMVKSHIKHTLS